MSVSMSTGTGNICWASSVTLFLYDYSVRISSKVSYRLTPSYQLHVVVEV